MRVRSSPGALEQRAIPSLHDASRPRFAGDRPDTFLLNQSERAQWMDGTINTSSYSSSHSSVHSEGHSQLWISAIHAAQLGHRGQNPSIRLTKHRFKFRNACQHAPGYRRLPVIPSQTRYRLSSKNRTEKRKRGSLDCLHKKNVFAQRPGYNSAYSTNRENTAGSSSSSTPKFGLDSPTLVLIPYSTPSSVPSAIRSTPQDLQSDVKPVNLETDTTTQFGSTVRRSKRNRTPNMRAEQLRGIMRASKSAKRRKLNHSPSNSDQTLVALSSISLSSEASRTGSDGDIRNPSSNEASYAFGLLSEESVAVDCVNLLEHVAKAKPVPKCATITGNVDNEEEILHSFFAKTSGHDYERKIDGDLLTEYLDECPSARNRLAKLSHDELKDKTFRSGFDKNKSAYYNARAYVVTASSDRVQSGSNQASETASPSGKDNRTTNGAKTGKGVGKAANKTIRLRGGGGRREDSPDPPNKPVLSQGEKLTLAQIRQRQAELKKFFNAVGNQQTDALELLCSRDLTKLLTKPKSHSKVPEYDQVAEELQRSEESIRKIVAAQYQLDTELIEKELGAQKEVLSQQFERHMEDSQSEHVRGAQGDLVIFRKAHLAAGDETRTNNGSDIEPYFPRYHEFPEPGARPRGYTSMRIEDEKPFKAHLLSYDEQANQEVIENEIVGPVAKSVAEQNARRHTEEQQKANLESLLTVSRDELHQMRGYLVSRPESQHGNPQFALSRLADCAEYITRKSEDKAYVFVPVSAADVDSLPLQHLEKPPIPKETVRSRPSTSASQRRPSSAKKLVVQRQKSLSVSAIKQEVEEPGKTGSPSQTSTSFPIIAPAPIKPFTASSIRPTPYHRSIAAIEMPPPAPVHGNELRPGSPGFTHRPNLAPLLTSIAPPVAPTHTLPSASPAFVPPPPSPNPLFGRPLHHSSYIPHYTPSIPPPPPPDRYRQYPFGGGPPPPPQPVDRHVPPPHSPLEQSAPMARPPPQQPSQPSIPPSQPRPKVGGPRREPGQITFTPAQTPDSERFRNPPQPQQLPPGQAVYRPSSLQQLNASTVAATPRITNTFVNAAPDANSRAQQAADSARQTAVINQGQGAGPKGGRRVLLPKKY